MPLVQTGHRFSAPPEFGKRFRFFMDDFMRADCRQMEAGQAIDRITGQTLLLLACDGSPHVFSLGEAHLVIKSLKAMKPEELAERRALKELIRRIKKAVHKMERR